MTVLLLVALGFLAVLAYGAFALGFTHVVFERLAQKQDQRVSGGRRFQRLEAIAEARRPWWRRLVG